MLNAQAVLEQALLGNAPANWHIYRAHRLSDLAKMGIGGASLLGWLTSAMEMTTQNGIEGKWWVYLALPFFAICLVATVVSQFRASRSVRGQLLALLPEGFVEKSSITRAIPYANLETITLDPERFDRQHEREVTLRWKTLEGAEDMLTLDERYGEPIPLALRILDAYGAFTAPRQSSSE